MNKKIIEKFRRSILFNSLIIINLIALFLIFIFVNKDGLFLQKSILVILILTLFVLIWYTIETRRMANIQHQDFIERQKPLLSVNISTGDTRTFQTIFHLTNHKALFTIAHVYANFTLEGKDLFVSDHYNGRIPWLIQPSSQITAPISLPKIIMGDRFKDDDSTYVHFVAENINKELKLDIRVEYESETGQKCQNRSVKYHYDFNRRVWVLDVDA